MTKRKMKDSGVEWLGEIPEDWEVTKNKYIFEQKKQIVGSDWENYQLLSLTTGGIIEKDINNLQGKLPESFGTYQVVEKDDLILCLFDLDMSAVFNSKSLFDGMISPAYRRYKLKVEGSINYYNYLFDYIFVDRKYTSYSTTLRFTLDNDEFGDIPTIVPSKSEQIKIAKFLDEKINIVNYNIIKITDEILKLKEYKKSIITEAVTKGLDRDVPMKDSGIEWIGEIPDHWQIKKLKYIADTICKGISPSYTEEELVPVINQASFSQGYLNKDFQYCNDDANSDAKLNYGDVLLATTGGGVLGKSFYFEEEGDYLASTDVAFIRTNNLNLSKFIYYIFSVNYDLFNGEFAKGSTNQTHLQMNLLSNMMLPLPSNSEIIKIVEYLDRLMINIENIINQKQVQIQSLEEYKKSIIYEYVTGKKEVGRG
ncbi:restriction endonuclease subunit S [Anaerococcus sp. ENR0831]|uniref:Restriction endonuclease subunit S n=1 Tax=Anaerococcus martiniensis TaxID=3115615 RepID=A0ABW9M9B6_9FIRM